VLSDISIIHSAQVGVVAIAIAVAVAAIAIAVAAIPRHLLLQ
jgi:hypothetical protein